MESISASQKNLTRRNGAYLCSLRKQTFHTPMSAGGTE